MQLDIYFFSKSGTITYNNNKKNFKCCITVLYIASMFNHGRQRCDFDIKSFTFRFSTVFCDCPVEPTSSCFLLENKKELGILNLMQYFQEYQQPRPTTDNMFLVFFFQILSITFNDQYQVLSKMSYSNFRFSKKISHMLLYFYSEKSKKNKKKFNIKFFFPGHPSIFHQNQVLQVNIYRSHHVDRKKKKIHSISC